MKAVVSASSSDTFDIGKRFSAYLVPGSVVVLTGDLGAGKTTFTQGIAAGLEIDKHITSPTFVIAKNYTTKNGTVLIHIDAYRLQGIEDLADLDLESHIDTAIIIAEWGEGLFETLGKVIHVKISIDSEHTRTLTFTSGDFDVESMNL